MKKEDGRVRLVKEEARVSVITVVPHAAQPVATLNAGHTIDVFCSEGMADWESYLGGSSSLSEDLWGSELTPVDLMLR